MASKFLAGALMGFVAGLLLAPERGEDLREEIVDTTDRWKTKLNRLVGRASSNLDDLRAMLENDIEGLGQDVKHRILTILDEADEMSYDNKNSLTNGVV